jgi:hypothetical protein
VFLIHIATSTVVTRATLKITRPICSQIQGDKDYCETTFLINIYLPEGDFASLHFSSVRLPTLSQTDSGCMLLSEMEISNSITLMIATTYT